MLCLLYDLVFVDYAYYLSIFLYRDGSDIFSVHQKSYLAQCLIRRYCDLVFVHKVFCTVCYIALKYEKENRYDPEEENENFQEYDDLDEFFATSEPRITTLKGQELFREIKERYEQAKQ